MWFLARLSLLSPDHSESSRRMGGHFEAYGWSGALRTMSYLIPRTSVRESLCIREDPWLKGSNLPGSRDYKVTRAVRAVQTSSSLG